MFTTAKRSLVPLLFSLVTVYSVHAQSDFISVNAPANATTAALVADGDTHTGWSPQDNTQDQYLLPALQNPGNVDRIELDADGLNPAKYGVHIKLLFKGGANPQLHAIKELKIGYAVTAVAQPAATAKPWLNPSLPVDQRVSVSASDTTIFQQSIALKIA